MVDKLGNRTVDALGAPLGLAFATLAAFAVVALVDPNEPGNYPTCPFLAVTGHWCPGCGSLRAMHALTKGDLGTAVGMNVLTLSSLPLLAVLWWRWTGRRWNGVGGTSPPRKPVHAALMWAIPIVVIVFWVVRNLPFGQALAP